MTLIDLRPGERSQLENFARHTEQAKAFRHAQALLWLDEGEAIPEIAERLGVSRQTVYNWATRFQQRSTLDLAERLADGPRSGRPPTALGVIDPLVLEVIDRDPRDWGYAATVWTAPLLQRDLGEVYDLDVSRPSVSLALDRLGIDWKRPRHRLAQRPDTWRQAKGG
jgi:transposase